MSGSYQVILVRPKSRWQNGSILCDKYIEPTVYNGMCGIYLHYIQVLHDKPIREYGYSYQRDTIGLGVSHGKMVHFHVTNA